MPTQASALPPRLPGAPQAHSLVGSASERLDALLPADQSAKRLAYWSLALASASLAGAAVWWFTKESYYSYVPLQYQYRPGTFTGWVANKLARHAKRRRSRRPIRVYMDGCFDLMHYGHANALRQARALGDQLVVGLIPDSEILRCKGPPILDERERLALVQSVKWVDQVITGVPYDLTPAFLEELFHRHKIDYVIHGDDPCLLPDGTDAYAHAKRAGRFLVIKRTEGVSTTDIVGRMLMCTRDNARFSEDKVLLAREFSRGRGAGSSDDEAEPPGQGPASPSTTAADAAAGPGPGCPPSIPEGAQLLPEAVGDGGPRNVTVSRFMPTSRRIVQFSSGVAAPPGARIVYIDGAFDLFHVGHVEILKKARRSGDFLLVGVHLDEDVAARRGPHLPIMGLHERALSVLACRYVDEVIIGAPQVITEDLLTTFGIGLVVRGSVHETAGGGAEVEAARYEVPRRLGILRELDSPDPTTSATVIHRIVRNRAAFEARNAKKASSEAKYYGADKQYVAEV